MNKMKDVKRLLFIVGLVLVLGLVFGCAQKARIGTATPGSDSEAKVVVKEPKEVSGELDEEAASSPEPVPESDQEVSGDKPSQEELDRLGNDLKGLEYDDISNLEE